MAMPLEERRRRQAAAIRALRAAPGKLLRELAEHDARKRPFCTDIEIGAIFRQAGQLPAMGKGRPGKS